MLTSLRVYGPVHESGNLAGSCRTENLKKKLKKVPQLAPFSAIVKVLQSGNHSGPQRGVKTVFLFLANQTQRVQDFQNESAKLAGESRTA